MEHVVLHKDAIKSKWCLLMYSFSGAEYLNKASILDIKLWYFLRSDFCLEDNDKARIENSGGGI